MINQYEFDLIIHFIEETDEFFVNWFNGAISRNSINQLDKYLDENLRIFYSDNFDELSTKNDLMKMLPEYYGIFAENPIERRTDIKFKQKLADNIVLVSIVENTLSNGKIKRSRPLSLLIDMREPLKLIYSHE